MTLTLIAWWGEGEGEDFLGDRMIFGEGRGVLLSVILISVCCLTKFKKKNTNTNQTTKPANTTHLLIHTYKQNTKQFIYIISLLNCRQNTLLKSKFNITFRKNSYDWSINKLGIHYARGNMSNGTNIPIYTRLHNLRGFVARTFIWIREVDPGKLYDYRNDLGKVG